MEPALSVGDKIYVDLNYPYEKLKEGDIVVYSDLEWGIDYGLVHRIYRLSRNNPVEWIIRGDNNKNIDPYNLTKENYEGKVVRVDFK